MVVSQTLPAGLPASLAREEGGPGRRAVTLPRPQQEVFTLPCPAPRLPPGLVSSTGPDTDTQDLSFSNGVLYIEEATCSAAPAPAQVAYKGDPGWLEGIMGCFKLPPWTWKPKPASLQKGKYSCKILGSRLPGSS